MFGVHWENKGPEGSKKAIVINQAAVVPDSRNKNLKNPKILFRLFIILEGNFGHVTY